MKKISLLTLLILSLSINCFAFDPLLIFSGSGATGGGGQDDISDFEGGTDGNSITTLAEWTESTAGDGDVILDDNDTITPHGGSFCALWSWSGSTNESVFDSGTVTQSSRYYLVTLYWYLSGAITDSNEGWFLTAYGSGGYMGVLRFVDAGGDQLQWYNTGWNAITSTITTSSWVKVEIQFDATNNEIYVSIDDGSALGPWAYANNGTFQKVQLRNDYDPGVSFWMDDIVGENFAADQLN